MNEISNTGIPLEAETKLVRPKMSNIDSLIERQVVAYTGYAEIIEEQKKQIEEMRQRIEFLEEKYSVYADETGETLSSNTTPFNSEDDSDWAEEDSIK
jgi:archaellum component FlaC